MPNPTPPAIKSTVPSVFQFCFLIPTGNYPAVVCGGSPAKISGMQ